MSERQEQVRDAIAVIVGAASFAFQERSSSLSDAEQAEMCIQRAFTFANVLVERHPELAKMFEQS